MASCASWAATFCEGTAFPAAYPRRQRKLGGDGDTSCPAAAKSTFAKNTTTSFNDAKAKGVHAQAPSASNPTHFLIFKEALLFDDIGHSESPSPTNYFPHSSGHKTVSQSLSTPKLEQL